MTDVHVVRTDLRPEPCRMVQGHAAAGGVWVYRDTKDPDERWALVRQCVHCEEMEPNMTDDNNDDPTDDDAQPEVSEQTLQAFHEVAAGATRRLLNGTCAHAEAPTADHDEGVIPIRDVQVGDWVQMPDARTWVQVEQITTGVCAAWGDGGQIRQVPSVMLIHAQGGFSNREPQQLMTVRRRVPAAAPEPEPELDDPWPGLPQELDTAQTVGVVVAGARPGATGCSPEDLDAWLGEPDWLRTLGRQLADLWEGIESSELPLQQRIGLVGDDGQIAPPGPDQVTHEIARPVAALVLLVAEDLREHLLQEIGDAREAAIVRAIVALADEDDINAAVGALLRRICDAADATLRGGES